MPDLIRHFINDTSPYALAIEHAPEGIPGSPLKEEAFNKKKVLKICFKRGDPGTESGNVYASALTGLR